tara:strand:+ start:709 stop:975 length:267 start_codon:yes stop_codon:yes gene_type:complete
MRLLNWTEAFMEGMDFIKKVWIGMYRTEGEWSGTLEEFYPSLAIANFSQQKLEDYLKEAIEGRAWLPKGMRVCYDENEQILITVTKEV